MKKTLLIIGGIIVIIILVVMGFRYWRVRYQPCPDYINCMPGSADYRCDNDEFYQRCPNVLRAQ